MQTPLVEVNEIGPTIQQDVIQRPVRGMQPDKETRFENQTRAVPQSRRGNNGNLMSGPEEKTEETGYQLKMRSHFPKAINSH